MVLIMKRRFSAVFVGMLLVTALWCNSFTACAFKSARNLPQKRYTFEEVDAAHVIAAKVNLMGLGDGYHAKIVFATPKSAFSFGIQYDNGASAPYTGRAMLITENIASNDPGGQKYDRPRNIELHIGKTYDLMMSLDKRGNIITFLNTKPVGRYTNKKLIGKKVRPRVEACGKHNGDIVDAEFSQVRIKDGKIDEVYAFMPYVLDTASNIKSRIVDSSHIYIHGKLSDIPADADWDSAYNSVSGIVQYNFD